jgi:cobalamin biosynthesis Mg chelatase CobN
MKLTIICLMLALSVFAGKGKITIPLEEGDKTAETKVTLAPVATNTLSPMATGSPASRVPLLIPARIPVTEPIPSVNATASSSPSPTFINESKQATSGTSESRQVEQGDSGITIDPSLTLINGENQAASGNQSEKQEKRSSNATSTIAVILVVIAILAAVVVFAFIGTRRQRKREKLEEQSIFSLKAPRRK